MNAISCHLNYLLTNLLDFLYCQLSYHGIKLPIRLSTSVITRLPAMVIPSDTVKNRMPVLSSAMNED